MLNILTKFIVDKKRDLDSRKERLNLICEEISSAPFSSFNFTFSPQKVGSTEIHTLDDFSISIFGKRNLHVWEDRWTFPLAHFGIVRSCNATLESESFSGNEAAKILTAAREAYAKGRVG